MDAFRFAKNRSNKISQTAEITCLNNYFKKSIQGSDKIAKPKFLLFFTLIF